MTPDIQALIDDTLQERPHAREQLARCFLPMILGWCMRMGGPRVDPEDAAHDALLIALDRLGGLRNRAAWKGWLYGITRRVLARHRRSAWIRRWRGAPDHQTRDSGPGPAERTALSRRASKVQLILEGLSEHHREVLVLCDAEERTATEVAAILGLPEGTVRSRLRVARQRFARAAEARGLHEPAAELALGRVP